MAISCAVRSRLQATCENNRFLFFSTFPISKRPFIKTGSGQTQGNLRKTTISTGISWRCARVAPPDRPSSERNRSAGDRQLLRRPRRVRDCFVLFPDRFQSSAFYFWKFLLCCRGDGCRDGHSCASLLIDNDSGSLHSLSGSKVAENSCGGGATQRNKNTFNAFSDENPPVLPRQA